MYTIWSGYLRKHSHEPEINYSVWVFLSLQDFKTRVRISVCFYFCSEQRRAFKLGTCTVEHIAPTDRQGSS